MSLFLVFIIIIVCICFIENKVYKDRDAGIKFAKLSYYLAKHFPHQEFQSLKLILLGKYLFSLINYNNKKSRAYISSYCSWSQFFFMCCSFRESQERISPKVSKLCIRMLYYSSWGKPLHSEGCHFYAVPLQTDGMWRTVFRMH